MKNTRRKNDFGEWEDIVYEHQWEGEFHEAISMNFEECLNDRYWKDKRLTDLEKIELNPCTHTEAFQDRYAELAEDMNKLGIHCPENFLEYKTEREYKRAYKRIRRKAAMVYELFGPIILALHYLPWPICTFMTIMHFLWPEQWFPGFKWFPAVIITGIIHELGTEFVGKIADRICEPMRSRERDLYICWKTYQWDKK